MKKLFLIYKNGEGLKRVEQVGRSLRAPNPTLILTHFFYITNEFGLKLNACNFEGFYNFSTEKLQKLLFEEHACHFFLKHLTFSAIFSQLIFSHCIRYFQYSRIEEQPNVRLH